MIRVSVLTITYRPGYILELARALKAQTLPREHWEWVLVDELWEERQQAVATLVNGSLDLHHIPCPKSPVTASTRAFNIGLSHCQGELVYCLADYMYPHPQALERHWGIYQKYGPRVLISGPLIDGITITGGSIGTGARPVWHQVLVGGQLITYPEHLPPVSLRLKPDFLSPTPENLLSILQEPFVPIWTARLATDWRMGQMATVSLERDVYECMSPAWWYAGRNDSASLAMLKAAGGMEERPGVHGGLEVELAARMMALGARYLVDRVAPAYILPHPTRKAEKGDYATAIKGGG